MQRKGKGWSPLNGSTPPTRHSHSLPHSFTLASASLLPVEQSTFHRKAANPSHYGRNPRHAHTHNALPNEKNMKTRNTERGRRGPYDKLPSKGFTESGSAFSEGVVVVVVFAPPPSSLSPAATHTHQSRAGERVEVRKEGGRREEEEDKNSKPLNPASSLRGKLFFSIHTYTYTPSKEQNEGETPQGNTAWRKRRPTG